MAPGRHRLDARAGAVPLRGGRRDGREPQFILLDENVPVGVSRRVAVLEMSRAAGLVAGLGGRQARDEAVHLRGSSGRWAPIATAESCDGGSVRLQQLRVPLRAGLGLVRAEAGRGAVRAGYRFLDGGHKLQSLAEAPALGGTYAAQPSAQSPLPYAFVATS